MNPSCSRCGQDLPGDAEGGLCAACSANFAVHLAKFGEDSTLGEHTMDVQSIAHYEVTGKLGAGGMGEVYGARDTKLGREVAIKILPDGMSGNVQVLSRFEREAKVLATLNHPNIATIHGIEEVEESKAIVMELVEGETLGERLRKGPMSVAECLPVFRQIASALEAAHEKGIIHRDLKPGNIKFTADGQVKVLDFGLAKPTVEGAEIDTEANTLMAETTVPGSVLGTPAYMSPEQTRGEAVDKRTDVWAFGCCLYECLTGRKPFKARTISDLMAEVLKSDPDFTIVPAETPTGILSLLRRCLEKEPRRRLRDLGDIAIRLEETTETSRMLERPMGSLEKGEAMPRSAPLFRITMGLLMIALAIGLGFYLAGKATPKTDETINSLAILPFENPLQDEGLALIAGGMSDAVFFKLGALDGLTLQQREKTLAEIREEDDSMVRHPVDAFVSGRLFKDDDSVRCTVSLTHRRTDEAERLGEFFYSGDKTVLAFHTEVAEAIARKVRTNLNQEEQEAIKASAGTEDPDAYKAYREAMEAYYTYTEEGFDDAERHLEVALRIDPGYGEALGWLASIPWIRTIWGGTKDHPEKAIAKSRRIFDERRSQVQEVRSFAHPEGWLAMYGDRDWAKAERLFREAVAFSKSAEAISARADYLLYSEGSYEEALELIDTALAQEPDHLGLLNTKINCLIFAGLYQEASGAARKIVEEDPQNWNALNQLGRCLHLLGETSEALEKVNRAVDLSDGKPLCLATRAFIYAQSGQEEDAKRELGRLDELAKTVYVDQVYLAYVYAALGDFETAFERLELAASKMGGWGLLTLRYRHLIQLFGKYPRYWDLIDKLKFRSLPPYHPDYELEQRMRSGARQIEQTGNIRSIAILPFEGNDLAKEWEVFATSMSSELREKLQVLEGVKIVIDRISLQERQAEGKSAAEVASLHQVDALVTGVIVEAQGQLKITVDLHKGDGSSEILGNFHYGMEDRIFEVQTDVALAVSKVLKSDLTEEEEAVMARSQTTNPAAYEEFQKGLRAYGTLTARGFADTEFYLKQAIALDPGYGGAVAMLGAMSWIKCVWGGTEMSFKEGLENARSILNEHSSAVRDRERLKRAYGWLALHDREWRRAESLLRENRLFRGLLDGGSYAKYLNWVEGDHSRAIELIDEELELEPNRMDLLQAKATIYFAEGRWEDCLDMGESIVDKQPSHWDARRMMAICLFRLDRRGPALKMAELSVALSDENPWCLSVRATVLALAGDDVGARKALTDLDDLATKVFVDQGGLALVEAALGDVEKGMDRFERVVSEGGWGVLILREALTIELFGKNERYWKLIDRLNFPALPVRHRYYPLEQQMRFGKTPIVEQ